MVAVNRSLTVLGTDGRKLVVVVPAFNEERSIGSVILKAHKYADIVLVVDDGSTDATAEIAEAAGAVVLRHEQNLGKGTALATGLYGAQKHNPSIVVTLDADGQHLPEEVACVAAPILKGQADIVVGSRYLEPKSRVPFHRILGHHVFNFITNQMSGVSLTDSQSGFRAFSPRALHAMSFHSAGFAVESEMQFWAQEQDLKMIEVPITIHYHDKPKRPVLVHGLMVLNGILRLIGQYRPLLFFGVPGLLILLIGLISGLWAIDAYRKFQTLAVGIALIGVLFTTIGLLTLFTGLILHSIRGLLIDHVRPKERVDKGA